MADDRIEIVFSADTGEFDAGVAAVAGKLDALASSVAMLQEAARGIGDAFAGSLSVAATAAEGSYAVARSEYQKEVQLIQDRFKLGKLTAEQETAALIAAENKRYAAQEATLDRSMALADKDSAAFERAEERKLVAANEHEKKLDQLRTQGIEQQIKQEEKAATQTVQSANRAYAAKISLLDNEYRQHKISLDQQIADERAAEEKRYETDLEALQPLLRNDNLRLEERRHILEQIEEVEATHARNVATINTKETQEIQRLWGSTFNQISSAFDTALNGVLRRTTTFSGAMKKLFDTLAIDFIGDVVKMMAQWAAFEALQSLGWGQMAKAVGNPFTSGSGLGGLVGGMLGSGGGGGGQGDAAMQQLVTAVTGNTASTVSNTGGIVDEIGSTIDSVGQVLGLTTASTAQTAAMTAGSAATTASTGATTGLIPAIVALTVAVEANTLAKAIPMPGFASGAWNIAQDMVAVVHQGEMIVPAASAPMARAFFSGGVPIGGVLPSVTLPSFPPANAGMATAAASSPGGTPIGGDIHVHLNLSAVDGQSASSFLRNNADALVGVIATKLRNASPALTRPMGR
jgi:hypothetical protein